MAMANASISWTNIPRDDREQDRLRLEQQLFRNISFEQSSIVLNEEDLDQDRDEFEMDMDLNRDFSRHHAAGTANRFDPAVYEEDEDEESLFSLEYPRNPQSPEPSIRYQPNENVDRYSLVSDRRHRRNRDYSPSFNDNGDHEEAETRSTIAHHASAVTIRTGLAGRRRVDSPSGIEYDPDRDLDALVRGAANLSVFDDDRSVRYPSRSLSLKLLTRPFLTFGPFTFCTVLLHVRYRMATVVAPVKSKNAHHEVNLPKRPMV
jgi:hypothetical protein